MSTIDDRRRRGVVLLSTSLAVLCVTACYVLVTSTQGSKAVQIIELSQTGNPYVARREEESHEYDRYLLHEVIQDGPSRAATAHPAVKQQAVRQQVQDRMTAKQADADFDSYFNEQAAKAVHESLARSAVHRKKLVDTALDKNMAHDYTLNHPQQLHTYADPRAKNTVGWDASWHRPAGSSNMANEQFNTDSWTTKAINTGVANAQAKSHKAPRSVTRTMSRSYGNPGNPDLPPMPGSYNDLVHNLDH